MRTAWRSVRTEQQVAWGYDADGELGNNSTTQSNVPVAVDTSAFAAGERFILIGRGPVSEVGLGLVATPVTPSARPLAWGYNGSGQLGDNSLVEQPRPRWRY